MTNEIEMQGQLEQLLNIPEIKPCIAGARHKITLSIVNAALQYAYFLYSFALGLFFPSEATCFPVHKKALPQSTDSNNSQSFSSRPAMLVGV